MKLKLKLMKLKNEKKKLDKEIQYIKKYIYI